MVTGVSRDMKPPAHARLRRLVNRAFVSRQVEKQRSEIEKLTHQLIDGFKPGGRVNLLTAYAEIIPLAGTARSQVELNSF